MQSSWIKPFFIVAGLYDGVLGLAFLFFAGALFQSFNVTPPNHPAYIQFPALLLVIFGALFFMIASSPAKYRDLIWLGVALKVSYSGTAFYHQLAEGIPAMWLPFAWADLVFLVLFVAAWKSLGTSPRSA